MPFPDLRADEVEAGPDEVEVGVHRTGTEEQSSTWGTFIFAGPQTPSSLVSTGTVGTVRRPDGSDGDDFGAVWTSHRVPVGDGRAAGLQLDRNGVQLVGSHVDAELAGLDLLDQDDVLKRYYPHCCELVRAITGATEVVAFDHNVRGREMKAQGAVIEGGNAVQGPASVIHNDYTVQGAPRRLEQLASEASSINDQSRQAGERLVSPATMRRVRQGGRWAMINVWRNILHTPVQKTPLAAVDGATVSLPRSQSASGDGEVVTFEIRYSDRVGENYMLKHKPSQDFYYFPAMERSEAMLIKVFDSASAAVGGDDEGIAPFSFHRSDSASPYVPPPILPPVNLHRMARPWAVYWVVPA
jgi:hypothetical protein